jgi:hypothetical protein
MLLAVMEKLSYPIRYGPPPKIPFFAMQQCLLGDIVQPIYHSITKIKATNL